MKHACSNCRGEKDLRLTLAPGTSVLALAPRMPMRRTAREALVWAPVAATSETLVTAASRLLLFGGDSSEGEVSLELLPRSAAGVALGRR